jgi:hypothetical protein
VHVYDWRAGQEMGAMHVHGGGIGTIRFLHDGRLLSGSDDGTTAIYSCQMCLPMDEVLRRARDLDRMHQQSPRPAG